MFTIIYMTWDHDADAYTPPSIMYAEHPSVADVFAWAEDSKIELIAVFEGHQDNLMEE